ncbi:MAG TPA: methyl-accepting chemotaxis protein [Noviherbaspirillum sp.]|uniref:methyl-accepting chemotaxis protein n=1 Tax=Noviherbaspirillum sp. TaxID=1926288 RepID=UPI002B472492|nr:methyl-accepting chemotaxis protein [Noviherbaspirillum sp.]HJV87373.1 methyl-accepting chemotaxis protein [Noviherbaspirillum sp.]
MNIRNMKVGTRLALSFGSVCILLWIILSVGLTQLSSLDDGTSSIVHDRWPKIAASTDLLAQTDRIAIDIRNMMLTDSKDDRQKQIDEIAQARKSTTTDLDKLERVIVIPKGKELLRQVSAAHERYVAGQDKLIALINEEKVPEAKAYLATELRPVLDAYKASLNALIQFQVELMDASGVTANRTFANARTVMLALGVLAILIAGGIGFLITRGLLKRLGGEPEFAAAVATRIASGDLRVDIDLRQNDDASMLHAMRAMRDNLAGIVTQVRQATDTIATASSQIASGNLDLSSRTEEQASSLQQTASSMEELTSTVKQNADNAQQANALALSASDVAGRGGMVVSQVVDTMGSINESAKKIVDIISVIDGIAFQTNILALNAAVEAARAGEQGRGFAVVATEVRNLAQRSASAAKEIKALINDSVEKIHVGAKLVDDAGATMGEIVDSVKRVSDIVGEITAASHEQTAGIEQINQAIAQMDEVTQQNASLVEEAAAASEAMQEQAQQLVQIVGAFQVDVTRLAAAAPAARSAARPRPSPSPVPARRTAKKLAASRQESAPRTRRIAAPPPAAGSEWEEF